MIPLCGFCGMWRKIIGFSLDLEELTSTLLTYDVVDMKKEHQKGLVEVMEKEGEILYEKPCNNARL